MKEGLNQKGFTLLEIMVAISIFMLVIGAAFSAYITMVKHSSTETAKAVDQMATNIDLQVLVTDIKNAGFAMPAICAVAPKDNLSEDEAKSWECIPNDKWNDYSNIEGTDRLYLADAGEIIQDFSDDCTEVGDLSNSDYKIISNAKIQNGYFAKLISDANEGDTSIAVDTNDIDGNDNNCICNSTCSGTSHCTSSRRKEKDCDFKARKALIIADSNSNKVEGRRIASNHNKTSLIISFKGGETLENDFPTNSYVVPAICYHLGIPTDKSPFCGQKQVFTLYRNSDPYIDGVEDFQVQYKYSGAWQDSFTLDPAHPEYLQAIWVGLVIRIQKKQKNIVYTDTSVSLKNPDGNTVHSYNLTDEMRHYYRRIYTIDVVPRNARAIKD